MDTDPENIDIKVAVVGTEKAVEDLKKIEKAEEQTASGAAANPMAMPERLMGPSRETEESIKATKKLSETVGDLAESTKSANDELKSMGEHVEDVATKSETLSESVGKSSEQVAGANKNLKEEKELYDSASESAGKHAGSIKKIETATRTLVALQAVDLLKQATAKIREATKEGGLLHDKMGELAPIMDGLDAGLDSASAGLSTFAATGNPVLAVVASLGSAVASLTKEYAGLVEVQEDVKVAEEDYRRQQEKTAKGLAFSKKNSDAKQHLHAIIEENNALHAQEVTFQRLIDLRNDLSGIAKTAADQEVEYAKTFGGDVALAEANAMSVKLNDKLLDLNTNLAKAQREVYQATSDQNVAATRLNNAQKAVKDGIQTAEQAGIAGLQEAVNSAKENTNDATQKLNITLAKYRGSQLNILRGAELELAKTEKEDTGLVSKAAKKARDGVYQSIKDELGKAPPAAQEAINQIQVDTQAIVSSVQTKAAEVTTAVDRTKTDAVNAVGKIATDAAASAPAFQASLDAARGQVQEALRSQTDSVIVAFNLVAATCIANTAKIRSLEVKTEALLNRSR